MLFERFLHLDRNAAIARHWLVGRISLDRMFGDYMCGMVALEAFYSDNPEVTAEYITQRLDGLLSEDSVRRRLKRMQDLGAVTCRKQGRLLLYRLRPDIAEAAMHYMAARPGSVQPQIAGKNP